MTSILILEDDPMVQFIHKSYLEKIDGAVQVQTAKNFAEAQDILSQQDIDLLLLDIHLGQENGLDILQTLRQENFAGEVILISAASEVQYIKKASHLGILDYLIKPFTFERFQESYQRFVEKKQLLSASQLPQEQVDSLFKAMTAENLIDNETFELEKGLTEATLSLVYQTIKSLKKNFTILEISEKVGLSHVSVRKYIQFLEAQHVLKSETIYRKIGRPYQVFHLNSVDNNFTGYLEKLGDN